MSDKRSERSIERDCRKGNDRVRIHSLARELMMSDSFMTQIEAIAKAREILSRKEI